MNNNGYNNPNYGNQDNSYRTNGYNYGTNDYYGGGQHSDSHVKKIMQEVYDRSAQYPPLRPRCQPIP